MSGMFLALERCKARNRKLTALRLHPRQSHEHCNRPSRITIVLGCGAFYCSGFFPMAHSRRQRPLYPSSSCLPFLHLQQISPLKRLQRIPRTAHAKPLRTISGVSDAVGDVGVLLERAAALIAGLGDDVLTKRISLHVPQPPTWLDQDWAAFVLGLTDEELVMAEQTGLRGLLKSRHAPNGPSSIISRAPASLVELANEVDQLDSSLVSSPPPAPQVNNFGMGVRKAQQVAAFAQAARLWLDTACVRRIVDVGAGLGRLTCELARQLGKPCLGLELDPAKVQRARDWVEKIGLPSVGTDAVSFEVCNVRSAQALAQWLKPGDLVIGLHPCGSLGEDVIGSVAHACSGDMPTPVSLLMVSCCLHGKPWAPLGEERRPHSALGQRLGLVLPRHALRMTNLGRAEGAPMERLEARLALRRLLLRRGHHEEHSVLLNGLSRRDQKEGFRGLAAKALEARGLPPAEERELVEMEATARSAMPALRRLELLSVLWGDLFEMTVNLDRARVLEEAGLQSGVGRLFPREVSPRNLAIHARSLRS